MPIRISIDSLSDKVSPAGQRSLLRNNHALCFSALLSLLLALTVSTSAQQDKRAEADRVLKEGLALLEQGTAESARAAFTKFGESRELAHSTDHKATEATSLLLMGKIAADLGENQRALDYYNQALPLWQAAGDKSGEASTLNNIGGVYDDALGENQKALNYYNQALPLWQAVGNKTGEATTLINIGKIYSHFREKQKALTYYHQALLLWQQVGNRLGGAMILTTIGSLYGDLGEKEKALNYYSQALPLWQAEGHKSGEATTLITIGRIYEDLGEKQKALNYFNQALPLWRAAEEKAGEATTLNNIGAVYDALGEKQNALNYYDQALVLVRMLKDKSGEARTLNNIGVVYDSLGENQKALNYYNQALPLVKMEGDNLAEAAILVSFGKVYHNLGEPQKALEYFNQALPLLKASNNSSEASVLNNIGMVCNSLGERQKALDYYHQALLLNKALGERASEATTLNNIGGVYSGLGEKQKSLDYFNQALLLSQAVGDKPGEATTLTNIMFAWKALNNPRFAVFYGKHAVNANQRLRANVSGLDKELQKTFLKSVEGAYRGLAELLISEGRLTEAQQVLNLFKDQQFFDFNSNTQKQASSLTLTKREAQSTERYEQATRRIEGVGQQLGELKRRIGERQPSAAEGAQGQQLEAQLKTASDEFMAFLKQAETEFSQPASEKDRVGETADTRELQTALRQLKEQTGQNAVVIYTLVGADNYRALVITSNSITAASQPVQDVVLNEKALQLWALLQSPSYDPAGLAQELYTAVFKPLESQIPKDTSTILWSLDGKLRYLPMAALHDGKQYLIERYNHVVFTRADSERLLRAVSPRWTGLGLGSSQAHTVELLGDKISFDALPGVNEEMRVIFRRAGYSGGIIEGDVLSDARFTNLAMVAALKQKRPVVHVSSHFSFRPGDEARSFLLLGDGTAMTLEEMKQHRDLFAGVELLTLSACNTAAQQAGANGREIDGFAELAQRLGAGSVIATLWPVADNSTPWLMRSLYETRENGNRLGKAEAMRRAQLALLGGTAQTKSLPEPEKGASSLVKIVITPNDSKRDRAGSRSEIVYMPEKRAPIFKPDDKKPFAHPYYWAPFILIGNWK